MTPTPGDFPTPDEAREQLAGIKAMVDQAVEAMGELARGAFAYYEGLKNAGFTEDQALYLTATYMSKPPTFIDS